MDKYSQTQHADPMIAVEERNREVRTGGEENRLMIK